MLIAPKAQRRARGRDTAQRACKPVPCRPEEAPVPVGRLFRSMCTAASALTCTVLSLCLASSFLRRSDVRLYARSRGSWWVAQGLGVSQAAGRPSRPKSISLPPCKISVPSLCRRCGRGTGHLRGQPAAPAGAELEPGNGKIRSPTAAPREQGPAQVGAFRGCGRNHAQLLRRNVPFFSEFVSKSLKSMVLLQEMKDANKLYARRDIVRCIFTK